MSHERKTVKSHEELVNRTAKLSRQPKPRVRLILAACAEAIKRMLVEGQPVRYSGLGVFYLNYYTQFKLLLPKLRFFKSVKQKVRNGPAAKHPELYVNPKSRLRKDRLQKRHLWYKEEEEKN